MARQLITAEVVVAEFERGVRRIAAPQGQAVITPEAWSTAQSLGVTFDQAPAATTAPATSSTGAGSCDRVIDASGVVVVRGRSVELGRFAGAGADKNVGLIDVVSRQQGSPMAAGFMSWARADSFDWRLDYDEIDYVLEGVLHLTVGGRVLEGKPGDVLYLPKGSSVTFGTPSRTRIFYVTYPAEWAQPAK